MFFDRIFNPEKIANSNERMKEIIATQQQQVLQFQ
jgi:hypothetical protein